MLTHSLDREHLDLSLCNPWTHQTSELTTPLLMKVPVSSQVSGHVFVC